MAARSEDGAPAYDPDNAAALASLDVPAFACTPALCPDLMAAAIQQRDLKPLAGDNGLSLKG